MRRLSTLIVIASVALTMAACSSGSSGGGNTTPTPSPNGVSDPATAKQQVTTLYNTFFSAPTAQAKTMVEDGASLGAAFAAAKKLAAGAKESSKVKSVTITGPGTANVTFDLYINGKDTLPGYQAKAVWSDGGWKVSKDTFCTLVGLGGPTPQGC
ncbi:MAG TPA: hypothetical protein VMH41_14575 [Mycobacteriales bacterium]|nr:hypothetical protein [Mycobacteriales bacterium]